MNKSSSRRKKFNSASSSDDTQQEKLAHQNITPLQDPANATIDVAAVEVPELTEDEQRDRLHLERKVERAFFEAGKALMELRGRKLYRSTHKTFEEYCRDRFGHSRRQSYLLMDAAVVFDCLIQKCDQFDHILPTAEGQIRPMTKLEPQQQQEVWQAAVEEAGGKVPSGRIVKDVVQRIMERTKLPNTYRVGEVCQILPKENPDLRGKAGCWCIVTHVGEFSCTVEAWDGEYTVRIDHLKPLNYSDVECQQMQEICDRITRVRENENLEDAARAMLRYLGELKRPYLTDVEEKLLSVIEQEDGVTD
ncbi:hypothetical protein H6G76_35000 [Nostoc sp. FACHB-152]|uniref:hypothetical protein n=1 Tax=Nostoc sp. FACHB-152 TaxID=2692837 RepID=UPI001686B1F8|nr:hypothetical protein [Nostoc sp. FACHB-152]MBD2452219.1 hypothetical protein [Nostoc sp. FACHB-152]